jgi:8-oxo-dGTP diphosphatase
MITSVAKWPVGPVRLTWVPQPTRYQEPVTAVHCFCFSGDQIVLVDVTGRGPSIPGGHVLAGELLLDGLGRELAEEASVVVESPVLLGAIEVDHSVNPLFGPGLGYPMKASQLLYAGSVNQFLPFEAKHETTRRIVVPILECPRQHHEWNEVLQAAFQHALASRVAG